MKKITIPSLLLTLLSIIFALIFIFPLYWGLVTSLKTEVEVISPNWTIFPKIFTLASYIDVLTKSQIFNWYLNSIITSFGITFLVILICMPCGYALSQLNFPGRNVLFISVLASIMVPGTALVIALFIMIAEFNMINSWAGIILPPVLSPVCVLPLNLGITTALALVTFIAAWNNFFWPFIMTTKQEMFTVPVAITSVDDAFGIFYAREMAVAMLAAGPIALLYIIFQKQVTKAIMMTSGIKG